VLKEKGRAICETAAADLFIPEVHQCVPKHVHPSSYREPLVCCFLAAVESQRSLHLRATRDQPENTPVWRTNRV
jgi:hypothetical protein